MSNWLQAQTLPERLRGLRRARASEAVLHFDSDLAARRLAVWKAATALSDRDTFAKMLAVYECSETEFSQLLGIAPVHLFPAGYTPDWLREIQASEEQFVSSLRLVPGLLSPCLALLNFYSRRFRDGLAALKPELHGVARELLHDQLLPAFFARLSFLAQRSVALEVNVQSTLGLLEGESPEARFQDFTKKMNKSSARLAFLEKYPVLARHLQRASAQWLEASLEFSHRLMADLGELREKFGITGPLEFLNPGMGDLHGQGRSVMLLSFANSKKLIYKPHALGIDVHFQELLDWCNRQKLNPPLRVLKILNRETHGWVEHVAHKFCENESEVADFYRRQGSLLAITHVLATTDMHFENIVAAGADPVLIDLETLFHADPIPPQPSSANEACALAIRRSVMAVGLLPTPVPSHQNKAFDSSGIGGKPGQSAPYKVLALQNVGKDDLRVEQVPGQFSKMHNRPHLNEQIPVGQLLEGFSTAYALFAQNKEELSQKIFQAFAKDRARIVVRPTRIYGTLALDATHPDLLRDDLDRARHWNQLWSGLKTRPELDKFITSELGQAENGDIPLFSIEPGSCAALGADGTPIPNAVHISGLATAQERLTQMSSEDQSEQEWFIRASLGYLEGFSSHLAETGSALEGARSVGQMILKKLISHGDQASCLNVMNLAGEDQADNSNNSIQPAGTGLYDGLAGIALFLAYLGAETGEDKFKLASEALLKNVLHTELARKYPSISVFSGRGALIYLLSHLGTLWQRGDLLDQAEILLANLPALMEKDEQLDIVSGGAGLLLAALALHASRPQSQALSLARLCGDRLLKQAWLATPFRRGFSHGASGISFALGELFAATNYDRYLQGALAAVNYERELLANGMWTDRHFKGNVHQASWCHGAPGIALARLGLHRIYPEAGLARDLEAALKESAENYWMPSQCLCHGVLGNLEPFLLGKTAELKTHAAVGGDGTARFLDQIQKSGWRSALPSQTLSLGLMTGLAGLGYGLLRLHRPDRIPSVLTLAPPANPRHRLL